MRLTSGDGAMLNDQYVPVCSDSVCRKATERMADQEPPVAGQDIYTPDGVYDEYSGQTYA